MDKDEKNTLPALASMRSDNTSMIPVSRQRIPLRIHPQSTVLALPKVETNQQNYFPSAMKSNDQSSNMSATIQQPSKYQIPNSAALQPNAAPSALPQLKQEASAQQASGAKRGRKKSSPLLNTTNSINGRPAANLEVKPKTDALVGKRIDGVVEGTFDAGYFLSVREPESNTILRGVIFDPNLTGTISEETDIAPKVKRVKGENTVFQQSTSSLGSVASHGQSSMASPQYQVVPSRHPKFDVSSRIQQSNIPVSFSSSNPNQSGVCFRNASGQIVTSQQNGLQTIVEANMSRKNSKEEENVCARRNVDEWTPISTMLMNPANATSPTKSKAEESGQSYSGSHMTGKNIPYNSGYFFQSRQNVPSNLHLANENMYFARPSLHSDASETAMFHQQMARLPTSSGIGFSTMTSNGASKPLVATSSSPQTFQMSVNAIQGSGRAETHNMGPPSSFSGFNTVVQASNCSSAFKDQNESQNPLNYGHANRLPSMASKSLKPFYGSGAILSSQPSESTASAQNQKSLQMENMPQNPSRSTTLEFDPPEDLFRQRNPMLRASDSYTAKPNELQPSIPFFMNNQKHNTGRVEARVTSPMLQNISFVQGNMNISNGTQTSAEPQQAVMQFDPHFQFPLSMAPGSIHMEGNRNEESSPPSDKTFVSEETVEQSVHQNGAKAADTEAKS